MNSKSPGRYFALIMALLVAFCLIRLPFLKTDSSVLSLLPEISDGNEEYEQAFLKKLDSQLFFLVSDEKKAEGAQAVRDFAAELKKSEYITDVYTGISKEQFQEFGRFSLKHAAALIDSKTRERLKDGSQADFVLSQIFMPAGGAGLAEISRDPLLLTRSGHINAQSSPLMKFKVEDDLTILEDKGRFYFMLTAGTKNDAFSTGDLASAASAIENSIKKVTEKYSGCEILKRGSLFYSNYASGIARHDLTVLGSCTVGGVILLMLLALGSLRPIFCTIVSILCGLIAGSAAVIICFDEIHLITAVMGLSIIGICTDYSIYYLSRRLLHGALETTYKSISLLKKPLLHAFATTAATYALLLIPPFPVLRQLSVFCIAGLACSCLSVFYLLPSLDGSSYEGSFRIDNSLRLSLIRKLQNIWQPALKPLTLTIAVIAAGALLFTRISDDPYDMQQSSEEIVAEDRQIASLTEQDSTQTFVMISAMSTENLGSRLEEASDLLKEAQSRKLIAGYWLPGYNSKKTQKEDSLLIEHSLEFLSPKLKALNIKVNQKAYADSSLSFEEFLTGPEGLATKRLLLNTTSGSALLLPLNGLTDASAFRALIREKGLVRTTLIDRRHDFERVFENYREKLSIMFAFALLLLFVVHLVREHSLKTAVRLFIPSALSALTALGMNALAGFPMSLFTILALFLVLGIGIDYVLFFKTRSTPQDETLFCITLAMLTTLMTLGILVFSATTVIASFGLTLASGIFTSWLLSPWAAEKKTEEKTD